MRAAKVALAILLVAGLAYMLYAILPVILLLLVLFFAGAILFGPFFGFLALYLPLRIVGLFFGLLRAALIGRSIRASRQAVRVRMAKAPRPSLWPLRRRAGRLGIPASMLGKGILVVGDWYEDVSRALIASILERGRRVLVIGSSGLIPKIDASSIRVVSLDMLSFNALDLPSRRLEKRVAAERVAAALTVAEGLDTAEVGMVSRFITSVVKDGRIELEDVDRLEPLFGRAELGRLRDACTLLAEYFSSPAPTLRDLLAGDWRLCLIEISARSSLSIFAQLYAVYNAPEIVDAVLVIENAEYVIPDINALPYDARHVWLRIYEALSRLRPRGLVLTSSSPLLSSSVTDLASCFVIACSAGEAIRVLRRLGIEVDQVSLKEGEAVVCIAEERRVYPTKVAKEPAIDRHLVEAEAKRLASKLRPGWPRPSGARCSAQ